MEECVLSHPDIAETLVVGIEDSLKGQIPYAIVVLKKDHSKKKESDLFKEITLIVRKIIGPVACLNNFSIVEKLPKTRSGKILRGIVRKILDKEEYNYPETIEDPEALKYIHEIADKFFVNREYNDYGVDEDLNMKKIKME